MTAALTTTQYTLLRGAGYAGNRLVSLFSNRVILSGQLDGGAFSTAPWASFTYTLTTGVYSDVLPDMTILAGAANDITQATFRGRVRTPGATSNTVNIGETSTNRATLLFFWIIDSFEPCYVQSRPSTSDPTTAVEIVDWNVTYQGLLPRAVGLQTGYAGYVDTTNKLRLGFDMSASEAAESGDSVSGYAFSFPNATLIAGSLSSAICIMDFPVGEQWGKLVLTDSGGRVLTRHFGIKVHDHTTNVPDTGFEGGSIGASLEQGYTLTIPAFAGVDDVLPNTFAICWRGDEQYSGVGGSLLGGSSASLTNKALTGNVATLTTGAAHSFAVGQTVIVADVDTTFNGTYVITAVGTTTFSYTKTHADVGSAACSGTAVVNPSNVDFVGWLNREDDPARADNVYSVISTANFTFTGIGPRMGRLEAQRLAIVMSAAPTLWREIVNPTPWRVIWHFLSRYTSFASLCDITFDSTANTYLFPEFSTEGENVLAVIQWIGQAINAQPEFYPAGRVHIPIDINYVPVGDRSGYTPVANWTSADAFEITRSYDPNPSIGKCDADGATYSPTTGAVTPFTARAPGTAQGEAQGTDNLSGQILASTDTIADANTELRTRVGMRFEVDNLKEYLDVVHPDGYVGAPLRPGRSEVYTWILSAVGGAGGVDRTNCTTATWWTIENISVEYNEELGAFALRTRYRRVIAGSSLGDDTTSHIPAQNTIPIALPDSGLPAFDFELPELTFPDSGLPATGVNPAQLLPPPGKAIAGNGQELIVWNATKAWLLRNAIALVVPQATDITPADLGSFQIKQVCVDPFSNFTTNVGAYLLASDGANSAVWYSSNVVSNAPVWTKGGSVTGLYTILRATGVANAIMIYSPNPGSVTPATVSVTYDAGGYSGYTVVQRPPGVTTIAAVGHPGNGLSVGPNSTQALCDVKITLPEVATVTNVKFDYNKVAGTGSVIGAVIEYYDAAGAPITTSSTSPAATLGTWYTRDTGVVSVTGVKYIDTISGNTATAGAKSYQDNSIVTYHAGSTTNAIALYSIDRGVGWVSQNIGTTPGSVGGFDIQRTGTNSFASIDGVVARATTLGGAYASYYTITGGAQARCIIVPYFNWAGTRQTAATHPDIIVGLNQADASSRTLLWIEGGATAGTVHDLTPVANLVFANADAVTCSYQHHLTCFGTVGGVYKLYRTTNQGGAWALVSSPVGPSFIRGRRNDNRAAVSGTSKGQVWLADSSLYYSSTWLASTPTAHIMPGAILGFETIY